MFFQRLQSQLLPTRVCFNDGLFESALSINTVELTKMQCSFQKFRQVELNSYLKDLAAEPSTG